MFSFDDFSDGVIFAFFRDFNLAFFKGHFSAKFPLKLRNTEDGRANGNFFGHGFGFLNDR